MITVKEAANSAIKYFQDIYNGPFSDLVLEEIEMSEEEDFWLVTLGYTLPPLTGLRAVMTDGITRREYKVFKINAETGDFVNMKIRNV